MEKDLKIAVAGTGYVGLSMATLLAQHHEVMAVDVVPEKIDLINHRQSPIQDDYIEQYLREKPLRLTATLDADMAYKDADFVVIATPTNYDPAKNYFDTTHVEEVIDKVLSVNPSATMVIKSTIPVAIRATSTSNMHSKARHNSTCCLHPSSSERAKPSTITSTPHASSWAIPSSFPAKRLRMRPSKR